MILADRASLFLVDVKTNQLYARLFNIEMDRELEVDNDINEELIRLYLEKESVEIFNVSDFLLMKELLDMLLELESLSILQMPTGVNTSIQELIKMY